MDSSVHACGLRQVLVSARPTRCFGRPVPSNKYRKSTGWQLVLFQQAKWKLWCNKNRHTGLKSIIPVDKRDRTVIEQDMEGDYNLHTILIQEFTRIQQEISQKKA